MAISTLVSRHSPDLAVAGLYLTLSVWAITTAISSVLLMWRIIKHIRAIISRCFRHLPFLERHSQSLQQDWRQVPRLLYDLTQRVLELISAITAFNSILEAQVPSFKEIYPGYEEVVNSFKKHCLIVLDDRVGLKAKFDEITASQGSNGLAPSVNPGVSGDLDRTPLDQFQGLLLRLLELTKALGPRLEHCCEITLPYAYLTNLSYGLRHNLEAPEEPTDILDPEPSLS